jgi:hypothetical protein
MSDDSFHQGGAERHGADWSGLGIGCAVVLLLYAPLLLSVIEQLLFGTRHVEDFLEPTPLYKPLSSLYGWTFHLFGLRP